MKTRKFMALCLFLIMLLGTTMNTNAVFNRSYTAPKGTPTLDAEVDDIWATAPWTNVDKPHNGTAQTDSIVRIKLLWDETHLYFLADVYDTAENKRNDIVEIYLDQNNEKASGYSADDTHTRFYVAQQGVVTADEGNGQNPQLDAPSASKSLGDNKYIVEGAISWPAGTPSIGDKMGLEFMYNDGNLYQAFTGAYRWNADTANGDAPPYAGTESFGTLTLADVGTPLEPDTYVEGEKMATPDDTNTDADTDTDTDVDIDTDTDTDTDADADVDAPNNTWLIVAGVAVAVIVLGAVIAMVVRKKKDN